MLTKTESIQAQRRDCLRQLPTENYCWLDDSGYRCGTHTPDWGIVGQCHCTYYDYDEPAETRSRRCKHVVGLEYDTRMACVCKDAIEQRSHNKQCDFMWVESERCRHMVFLRGFTLCQIAIATGGNCGKACSYALDGKKCSDFDKCGDYGRTYARKVFPVKGAVGQTQMSDEDWAKVVAGGELLERADKDGYTVADVKERGEG